MLIVATVKWITTTLSDVVLKPLLHTQLVVILSDLVRGYFGRLFKEIVFREKSQWFIVSSSLSFKQFEIYVS